MRRIFTLAVIASLHVSCVDDEEGTDPDSESEDGWTNTTTATTSASSASSSGTTTSETTTSGTTTSTSSSGTTTSGESSGGGSDPSGDSEGADPGSGCEGYCTVFSDCIEDAWFDDVDECIAECEDEVAAAVQDGPECEAAVLALNECLGALGCDEFTGWYDEDPPDSYACKDVDEQTLEVCEELALRHGAWPRFQQS